MNTFNFTTTMHFNSVVIIDCLGENDLQTGRSLYDALLDLSEPHEEFQVMRVQVGSIADITHCLQQVARQCRDYRWRPILHFEAHGSVSGFELGDELPELCDWTLLIPSLRALNAACEYNLGVFFSACEGAAALKPVTIRAAVPFQYLIGPTTRLSAGFLAERALAFYRKFLASSNITSAFQLTFAGHPFLLFLAEQMLAVSYGRFLRMQSMGKAQKRRVDELINMATRQVHRRKSSRRLGRKSSDSLALTPSGAMKFSGGFCLGECRTPSRRSSIFCAPGKSGQTILPQE